MCFVNNTNDETQPRTQQAVRRTDRNDDVEMVVMWTHRIGLWRAPSHMTTGRQLPFQSPAGERTCTSSSTGDAVHPTDKTSLDRSLQSVTRRVNKIKIHCPTTLRMSEILRRCSTTSVRLSPSTLHRVRMAGWEQTLTRVFCDTKLTITSNCKAIKRYAHRTRYGSVMPNEGYA